MLYKTKREFGIPIYFVKLLELAQGKMEWIVRVNGSISEMSKGCSDLRQRDALSCSLFNLALEKVPFKNTLRDQYNRNHGHQVYTDRVDFIST